MLSRSSLIGVVLAYQGADQLQRFGAQIFVVNLIGIAVVREMGILLAAIIVAGRSGSAFTAEIRSMKLREEIDAMRTLGLDPVDLLVIPRLLALIIVMPLLAFYADLMGRVPQRRPSRYRFRVGLAESTRPEENHDDRQRHDDAARAVGKEF